MAKMTHKELLEFNKNREITQICLITSRDRIEDLLDEWIDKLKVGPWLICEISDKDVEYAGWGDEKVTEPFKYTCATAQYGNIQIEILKKEYGVFPGNKFLETHKEGLQHFKEKFADDKLDDAIKFFEDNGLKKTWWGGMFGDRFCNFDSDEQVGFVLEVGNAAECEIPEDLKCYWYPPVEE